jgi:hypothetical protein
MEVTIQLLRKEQDVLTSEYNIAKGELENKIQVIAVEN